MSDIDFRTYEGCTSITGTKLLAEYIKEKFPEIMIIVHRDRDYLTDKEISDLEMEFKAIGVEIFITDGTDIEWYFISNAHIAECYPSFSVEQIEKIRKDAFSELEDKFYDLLMKKEHGEKYAKKSIHAEKLLRDLVKLERYWHGKLTLKKINSIIQTETKKNSNLIIKSKFVCVYQLQEIYKKSLGQEDSSHENQFFK